MSRSEGKAQRLGRWWMAPMLVALMTAGVPVAAPSSASDADTAGVRAAAAEDPMVTEIRKVVDVFIQRWNANKLDELVAAHYVEDAVMLPPNHEPIRGREAILTYIKSLRDAVGEFDQGDYLLRAHVSGKDQVSWVGQYGLRGGKLRITAHELYVRQPDGSMRNAVDMFGYRDPLS